MENTVMYVYASAMNYAEATQQEIARMTESQKQSQQHILQLQQENAKLGNEMEHLKTNHASQCAQADKQYRQMEANVEQMKQQRPPKNRGYEGSQREYERRGKRANRHRDKHSQ